jgi:hypothetical protein
VDGEFGNSARCGVDYYVSRVFTVELRLAAHEIVHGGIRLYAVDGADEIQFALYRPNLVVPLRRQNARRVANGDPADGDNGARGDNRIYLNNCVNPHFRARANSTSGKQRCAGRDKDSVRHGTTVDMRVGSNHDSASDRRRMFCPPSNQSMLHDHGVLADRDTPVFGSQDSVVKNARSGRDFYVTDNH